MPHYRVFTLDRAGHFSDVDEMFCVNDAEAILTASKRVDGHDLEVWHKGRMVTRIPAAGNDVAQEATAATEPALA
jgi:hypothetical protein